MSTLPMDHFVLLDEVREFLPEHDCRSPKLPGSNLATPEWIGARRASTGEPVELSTGIMPSFGERPYREFRIIGVTYPRVNGRPDERDDCCFTWDEVRAALGYQPLNVGGGSSAESASSA